MAATKLYAHYGERYHEALKTRIPRLNVDDATGFREWSPNGKDSRITEQLGIKASHLHPPHDTKKAESQVVPPKSAKTIAPKRNSAATGGTTASRKRRTRQDDLV